MQREPSSQALPLGLAVISLFLVFEAAKCVYDLVGFFRTGMHDQWWTHPLLVKSCIQFLICLLLSALILLRMRAALYWCLAYFVVSLSMTAYTLVEIAPELWVGIGTQRRWLTLSSCAVDAVFLAYLLGPRARVLQR